MVPAANSSRCRLRARSARFSFARYVRGESTTLALIYSKRYFDRSNVADRKMLVVQL
jgi:hypothetical protein